MHNCFRYLNIDISNALLPELSSLENLEKRFVVENNPQGHWYFQKEVFTDDWLYYMNNELGLEPHFVMIIRRSTTYYPNVAHVDAADTSTIWAPPAMNWTFGGTNSYHEWYTVNNNVNDGDSIKTDNETGDTRYKYLGWELSNLTPLTRCYIKKQPVLVNTLIPHAVFQNNSDVPRWCISVRFAGTLSWTSQLRLFKDLIDNTKDYN